MDKQTLKKCLKYASDKNIDLFLDPLNKVMEIYHINTPNRIAAFLAQLAHESESFKYVKEIASGESYEGRKDLGNTEPGDGVRFKGRGLIQLTGRANYQLFKETFGVDVIAKPELLEQPYYATLAAGWFWNKRKLNIISDAGDEASFKLITKRINGGLNGYDDRVKHWKRCISALKVASVL